MRKPLIAGNWKMNNNIAQSVELARGLVEYSKNCGLDRDILICVPYTALYPVKQIVAGSKVKLGAQNMYFEEKGAFTGEISPIMLNDIGVDYCIIGHSERRQYFGETDELLNKKLKSAISHNIKPILCVGETLEQREANIQKETIKNQIVKDLDGISSEDIKTLIVAYEPIWAIGTGKTATSDQAQEIISYIRSIVKDLYNESISENVIIQYGGSVKGSNAADIMSKQDIDGALVGGASLKLDDFIQIIAY